MSRIGLNVTAHEHQKRRKIFIELDAVCVTWFLSGPLHSTTDLIQKKKVSLTWLTPTWLKTIFIHAFNQFPFLDKKHWPRWSTLQNKNAHIFRVWPYFSKKFFSSFEAVTVPSILWMKCVCRHLTCNPAPDAVSSAIIRSTCPLIWICRTCQLANVWRRDNKPPKSQENLTSEKSSEQKGPLSILCSRSREIFYFIFSSSFFLFRNTLRANKSLILAILADAPRCVPRAGPSS